MDNQHLETPVSIKSSQRQSILLKTSRRSTFLARPQDQSEPPVANPHNSTRRNTELRKEYESVLSINRALASVVDNLEKTKAQIKHFADTVDQTDGLLDIWLSILQKSEESKAVIEDTHAGEALPEKRKEFDSKAPSNTMRKRRINE